MPRKYKKHREFVLEIEDQNPPDSGISTSRLHKVGSTFNHKCKKSEIVEYLVMAPTDDLRPRYKVFIGLSEEMNPVDRHCFTGPTYIGEKCFTEQ
jgi:hypothetical protein